jgi:hypothetical protein
MKSIASIIIYSILFLAGSVFGQSFVIPLPEVSGESAVKFTKSAEASAVPVVNKKGKTTNGYRTSNQEFVNEMLIPQILRHRQQLENLPPKEIVNALTIFIFQMYQRYIGKSFYRWGGDILDLDDAQYESPRHSKKYGLDCSGFSTSGYELAAHLQLIAEDEAFALFSSAGLRRLHEETGFPLRGALDGGNNNYRWDTVELNEAGAMVFKLAKGEKPTAGQIAMLQAGDLVGMNGHFGVIVFMDGKPMYLESGGWALSKNNENPISALQGLTLFAKHAAIAVHRVK